jgi:Dolichyl-phosphate-mannose-protein mannosyltransferase
MISRGLLAVLACWSAAALAVQPFQPVPFVDDWVYAWSVENLLANQRLEVLDFSSNVIYAQVLWGALFCLPFGFSFAALRVSTWVLAGIALAGMYRLLREAGATDGSASFGASALAVFPPFLMLSFSFMTDVPLVAIETWALVCFVRAHRDRSSRDLWMGTGLTAVAGAVRVVGIVPSIAMAAALLFDPRGWGRARGRFLVPLAACMAAWTLAWYHQQHVRQVADLSYIENSAAARVEALREYGVALLPAWLPLSAEFLAVGVGLALAPLAVALVPVPGQARRMAALLVLSVLIVTVGHLTGALHYPMFASEGTWLSDELGSAVTLLPGWTPVTVPAGVTVAMTIGCWVSFLVIGASAIRPRALEAIHAPLWWLLGVLLLMTSVLWLATDRYILAFLAPALALALGRSARVSWTRGVVALSIFAIVGVVAVRDRLNAERAIWAAVNDLRQAGVPVSEIDAGYVVNGWLQYAHPEQAHRNAAGNVDVPFVNGDALLSWAVAASPLPETEVVREYPFGRIGRAPGSVFVLRRR